MRKCCEHWYEGCPMDLALGLNEYQGHHLDLMRDTLTMPTGDPKENDALKLIGPWWERYLVMWPEDQEGNYLIRRFHHVAGDWQEGNLWSGWFTRDQIEGRMVPPPPVGRNYTGLFEFDEVEGCYYNLPDLKDRKSVMWMSDTPSEVLDHMEVADRAFGQVLITGLGLGILPKALLEIPCVEHITIIERTPEIIKLVGKYLPADKVTIIHGDAYKPPAELLPHYDIIWHDIWPTIGVDNLPGMRKLARLYKPFGASWMGYWRKETCLGHERLYRQWDKVKDDPKQREEAVALALQIWGLGR